MREQLEGLLINLAIPIAVGVFLTSLKKILDNMMILLKYFGRPAPVYL